MTTIRAMPGLSVVCVLTAIDIAPAFAETSIGLGASCIPDAAAGIAALPPTSNAG